MQYPANLYETLELPRFASAAEVKIAFRRLAVKYHPDKNPGNYEAEEHFKRITAAYQILEDPTKKQSYDNQLRGFNFDSYFQNDTQRETKEEKMRRVREMRRKKKQKEDEDTIRTFEQMTEKLSIGKRYLVFSLLTFLGAWLIFTNSYLNEHNNNIWYVIIGVITFIISLVYIFDMLYKKWNYEWAKNIIKKDPGPKTATLFILSFIGLMYLSFSASYRYKSYMLLHHSARTTALVAGRIDKYTLRLQYTVNSETFSKMYQINANEDAAHFIDGGDRVIIEYVENNPRICRIVGIYSKNRW